MYCDECKDQAHAAIKELEDANDVLRTGTVKLGDALKATRLQNERLQNALEGCVNALRDIGGARGLVADHGDALDAGLNLLNGEALKRMGYAVKPKNEMGCCAKCFEAPYWPHRCECHIEKRICVVQTNCHGGKCGNLLPCDIHPGQS